jgi:tRNA(Arg) A34 adenosine deaminase TadA
MKNFCRIVCVCSAGVLAIILCAYLNPRAFLAEGLESTDTIMRLETLGDSALVSRDVPVAALVLYGERVLGSGYNTVKRDGNAGGHAEINAISAAVCAMGLSRFRQLDRDSLLLVTTFEPCAMCRGAIVEYNIKHVEILKRKSVLELAREDLRVLRYYLGRTVVGPASLQDTLFHRHPDFSGH